MLSPIALAAQSVPRPAGVVVLWSTLRNVPDAFAKESVVFPRAYAACPQPEAARTALETGRYPHAVVVGPALNDVFKEYRLAIANSAEEVTRIAGAARDSIVVFAGAPTGREESALERSLRVSVAIRWRGVLAPRSAPEILLSEADLAPTVLALAGVDPVEGMQGRDHSRLLLAGRGEVPDSIYAEGSAGSKTGWRAVIRGFDKLVFNLKEEVLAMYNIAEDPLEENNLVREAGRDPALKLMRDGLLALARTWMRRLEDGRGSSGVKLRF